MSSKLHPDGKLNPSNLVTNYSSNHSILDIIEQRRVTRRNFLKSSAGTVAGISAATVLGIAAKEVTAKRHPKIEPAIGAIGFSAISPNTAPMTDGVSVPQGYTARVLVSWGDSLTMEPHWDTAGAMDEATQLHTFGAHTDGMHFFPMPGPLGNRRGLLVANSEYCDPALVNNITPAVEYSTAAITLDMVRAQQAAHGVNIVMISKRQGQWEINRRSPFNRRITGNTPCKISGPAAGHDLMKTATDPRGRHVLGTLNNCAHGYTPWGTYLSCEENWNGYFGSRSEAFSPSAHESRYGISKNGFGYRWHEVDERFDVEMHRNEPNRFGWVVEIDPFNPWDTPVKRTALGRFKHESAMVVVDHEDRVAVYMGDDERNEYVYKFVSASKMKRGNAASNRNLLEEGILYVARFDADGSGEWLPMVWGQNGLTPENGFADQAEVLIKTRQAADRVGATMMDRPEWIAAHPVTNEIYLTLTNNNRRGSTPTSSNNFDGTSGAGSSRPAIDAANPRPDNDFGHIIRWRDDRGSVQSTYFEWDIFVQCGDKATTKTLGSGYVADGHDGYTGNINGDDYGAPDGLWFDREGRLWIQTDQSGDATGDWINIGGNVMMCADPVSGETRRFLTSPPNSEVTGVVTTPDGRTMFVGIQHPGEDWETDFTDNSAWPDNGYNGSTTFAGVSVHKPRSSIIVITKDDGGVVGS